MRASPKFREETSKKHGRHHCTNRAFAEWREVFPNAACVLSMVDQLMHDAEIVSIEGESYRAKKKPGKAPSERSNSA